MIKHRKLQYCTWYLNELMKTIQIWCFWSHIRDNLSTAKLSELIFEQSKRVGWKVTYIPPLTLHFTSLHFTCNQWFLKSVIFAPCLPLVGFIKPKYLLAYHLENLSMAEHLLLVVFCFRSWKGLQWKWETTGFIDK